MHDGGRIATAKHAQQQRNSNFCSTGIPQNRISGNNWSIFVFQAECPSCRPANSIKALEERQPGTSPGGPHHFLIYQPTPDGMDATSFKPVLNTCVTRSNGAVHTSAKVRLTSAAIWRIGTSSRFMSINHFPHLPIVTNP